MELPGKPDVIAGTVGRQRIVVTQKQQLVDLAPFGQHPADQIVVKRLVSVVGSNHGGKKATAKEVRSDLAAFGRPRAVVGNPETKAVGLALHAAAAVVAAGPVAAAGEHGPPHA